MRTSSIARPGVTIRRGADRHQTRIGWLHGRHSFDTGIDRLGADTHHGVLVVSNHDTIAPRSGFDTHPHRNMEIVTWVLDGSLVHQDSEGHVGVIYPNLAQRMTAGTGILHSEFNPSPKDPTHLLQIWIVPERKNLKPEYEQLAFPDKDLRGKFLHVAGPKAPVTIRQDADLFIARLDKNDETKHEIKTGRHAWVQVAKGNVRLNDVELKQGDGAAISKENEIHVVAKEPSEVLLFDLA